MKMNKLCHHLENPYLLLLQRESQLVSDFKILSIEKSILYSDKYEENIHTKTQNVKNK